MQLQELHRWEPDIGLAYHVGLDGLSLLMLAVSSVVVLMAVAAMGMKVQIEIFKHCLVLILPARRVGPPATELCNLFLAFAQGWFA